MIHPRNPGQALDTGPGLAHTDDMPTARHTARPTPAERQARRIAVEAAEQAALAAASAYIAGDLPRPAFIAAMVAAHAVYGPCSCMACREAQG